MHTWAPRGGTHWRRLVPPKNCATVWRLVPASGVAAAFLTITRPVRRTSCEKPRGSQHRSLAQIDYSSIVAPLFVSCDLICYGPAIVAEIVMSLFRKWCCSTASSFAHDRCTFGSHCVNVYRANDSPHVSTHVSQVVHNWFALVSQLVHNWFRY